MTEDQRFASRRTDVVTWQTEPLDHDVVIAGPIKVNLRASSSGTDSDFIVKVIDVHCHCVIPEVAAVVTFLCSERASVVTGAAQRADGGTIKSAY